MKFMLTVVVYKSNYCGTSRRHKSRVLMTGAGGVGCRKGRGGRRSQTERGIRDRSASAAVRTCDTTATLRGRPGEQSGPTFLLCHVSLFHEQ